MKSSTSVLSPARGAHSGGRGAHRRDRIGDVTFCAGWRAQWRTRGLAPADAVRPARIEIRGATVRAVWGWQGWHERSWRRGDVGFVCSSRTAGEPGVPTRLILVVDRRFDEGEVAAVWACDAFDPEAYAALTRHLRNFEAIGDAERATFDPLAAHGAYRRFETRGAQPVGSLP